MSAALPTSILVSRLPTNPSTVSTLKSVAACSEIYAIRDQLVGVIGVDDAIEALRRTNAIERYVKDKEHKAEASYAARILETAVGAALGEAENGGDRKSKNHLPRVEADISIQDRNRFRLLFQYRDQWWPLIEKKFKPEHRHMPRREALKQIEAIRRPKANGHGGARIQLAEARQWLADIDSVVGYADLLLTDPPYSTDVEDVAAFASWLPLALSKLKPSARALVFIGAYAPELAAYFSTKLPDGWEWGVPHAWVYRNAIGPTPDMDFVRNWQCVLSARGPEADKLNSDRITELLAGFIENAPDGRLDVKYHRWQKPLPLVQRLIRVATDAGGVVIDPFAGSGTTLLAAKAEGRFGIGCDSDQDAFDAAVERGCDAA